MSSTHRMQPEGIPGKALEDWGGYPPETLDAGTPQQHGVLYLDDTVHKVTAGVWTCTAMTGKMGAWSSNEFMVLLEGTVNVVHHSGEELTVHAGECFVIPKGTICQWKQPGFVRKFFVIEENSAISGADDPTRLKAFKVDTSAALPAAKGPDPALIIGEQQPTWGDRLVYEDPSGQFLVGVWSTTPYRRKTIDFPRHELMLLLEGSVTISDDQGDEQTFNAGETILVEKGTRMGWSNGEPVKKVYCIYLPKAVATPRAVAAE